jgi:hypothetical protein
MNFIPLLRELVAVSSLPVSSFRLNRGAKVTTFFYFPNLDKKKIYLFL